MLGAWHINRISWKRSSKLPIEVLIKTVDYPFPSFKFPPLNEVSVGIQFEPLDRLRIPHFGSFWERVRNDFPLVEHASPIVNRDTGFLSDPDTGLPLPRVWLINQTETRLIQLQANRFNFNWRIQGGAEPYPRYPEVATKFFHYLKAFEGFLADTGIGIIQPVVTELTYINILEQGKEWNSVEDISNIIRDFSWEKQVNRFLPNPKEINWAAAFPFHDDQGTLNVRLNHAKRVEDNQSVLQLEMAASRVVSGQARTSIESWYELAHEWIVKGFVDLTKPEAQKKYWGREK